MFVPGLINLSEAFKKHLLRGDVKNLLVGLNQAGLHREAKSVDIFFRNPAIKEVQLPAEIWNGEGNCVASSIPPTNANEGDIWFDIIELTPHILINNAHDYSIATKGWYALRPVLKWQFEAFGDIVDIQTYYKHAKLFDKKRLSEISPYGFISNIFQVEGKAYASWFGKKIASGELENVLRSRFSGLLDSMMPDNFALWDSGVVTSGFAHAYAKNDLSRLEEGWIRN
jgi:hypothetical protein